MNSTQLKSLLKFLLIFLITLAGCAKEEINSPLVGEWVGISFTTSVPVDENQDGVANTDLMQEMNCVSMEAKFSGSGSFSIISTDEILVMKDLFYDEDSVLITYAVEFRKQ